MIIIERILSPIYELPCWNVRLGEGSALSLEFGEPHLEILEASDGEGAGHLRRRAVSAHGEWHIAIERCQWTLSSSSRCIARGDTSRTRAERAIKILEGQKITRIEISPYAADTAWDFEYGEKLVTRSIDHNTQSPAVQWYLFDPKGNVFAVRDDGKYCYQPATDKKIKWLTLQP